MRKVTEHLIVSLFKEVVELYEKTEMDLEEVFNKIASETDSPEVGTAAYLIAKKLNFKVKYYRGDVGEKGAYLVFNKESPPISETQAAKIIWGKSGRADKFFNTFTLKGHIEPINFPGERRRYIESEVRALIEEFRMVLKNKK